MNIIDRCWKWRNFGSARGCGSSCSGHLCSIHFLRKRPVGIDTEKCTTSARMMTMIQRREDDVEPDVDLGEVYFGHPQRCRPRRLPGLSCDADPLPMSRARSRSGDHDRRWPQLPNIHFVTRGYEADRAPRRIWGGWRSSQRTDVAARRSTDLAVRRRSSAAPLHVVDLRTRLRRHTRRCRAAARRAPRPSGSTRSATPHSSPSSFGEGTGVAAIPTSLAARTQRRARRGPTRTRRRRTLSARGSREHLAHRSERRVDVGVGVPVADAEAHRAGAERAERAVRPRRAVQTAAHRDPVAAIEQ